MSRLNHVRRIAMCAMLLIAGTALAAPFTSTQSGDWNLSSTWGGLGVPGTGDDVTITSNHVVTVSDLRIALTVTLDSTAGNKMLVINNTGNLLVERAIHPAIDINAPSPGSTNIIRIDGGTLQTSDSGITITGGASDVSKLEFTSLGGLATFTGDIAFAGTSANAQIDMSASGTSAVELTGDLGNGGTIINNALSSFVFNGTGPQTINSYTFSRLEIDKTGGTATLNGPVTVNADLNVNAGLFDDGGYQINLNGGLTTLVSVGAFGVLKLGSAATATTFPSPVAAANVAFAPGSAVVYQAGVPQSINGSLFYKRLYLSTLGVVPVTKVFTGANLFVEEQLDITDNGAGIVTLNVATVFLDVDGNITGDGSIALGGGTIDVGGNWSSAMSLSATSGTVTYDGIGAQSVLGATYPNLTINKTAGSATFNGNATVNGTLNILGSATLSTGAITLTLLGDSTVNTALDASAGTVRFNGTGAQSFNSPFSGFPVANLENNNATDLSITSGGLGTTITNSLTLSGAGLSVNGTFMVDVLATVTRTSGWILGPLTMGMNSTPARTFHVGTATSYIPVTADANTPGTLTIGALDGQHPDRTGNNVLDRYWQIGASTVTNLDSITFKYNLTDLTDGTEANYILSQYDGGSLTFTHYGSVNTVTHEATAFGVTGFMTDWLVGEPGSLAAPSQLSIFSVNGGVDPTVNVPFDVVVEAHDDNGDLSPVFVDTDFTLSLDVGTGSLGGTLTGTILAGNDTATVTGVTYDTVETGVQMRATRTSGDVLTDGVLSFDVVGPPSTITVTNVNDSGAGSLRDAITTHNGGGCTIPCTIDFSTGGEIVLLSPLPAITIGDLTIDGYTAPGASANTNAFGQPSNANITLQLNGNNSVPFGFDVLTTNVKIAGFAIKNFVNAGVRFTGTNTGSNVSGCHLGTDASGLVASANAGGLLFNGSVGASAGGIMPAQRNIISGNTNWGVTIDATSSTISVAGNYVGPRRDLASALPNIDGIVVFDGAAGVAIGTAGVGNVLSGNSANGIVLGCDNATIVSNLIGTAGSAALAMPNSTGIVLNSTASSNTIGGVSPSDANVISGNLQNGILINGDSNTIDNNLLGLASDGTTALGNSGSGIRLETTASNNIIGTSLGNKLVNNLNDGVAVATTAAGIGNIIRRNKIAGNTNRAIDLADDGTTPNDATDPDTGANNLQNFPTVASANLNAGIVEIVMSLDSSGGTGNTHYVFEVFQADNSSPRQAAVYLGNSGCLAGDTFTNINVNVPAGATTVGSFIVMTASAYGDAACTVPSEGTSELSAGARVGGDIHWIAGTGNWETPTNWNPATVPTSADDAYIDNTGTYTVTINTIVSVASVHVGAASGVQTLDVPGSQSLTFTSLSDVTANGKLSFGGINLGGTGPLSVSGTLDWSGGAFSGGGGVTINSGGILNINSAANKFVNASLLTIASGATANWNGGLINLVAAGAIDNFGLFESKTDANIADGGSPGTFDNTGTFRKSTTTGVTEFVNITFNHSGGTVDVQTGRLNLAGGIASAPFTISTGADVFINDNIYTLAAGASSTGLGKIQISGGTLNVTGPSVLIEHLLLDGGVLGGAGIARTGASGNWVWSGGTMGGSGSSLIETGSSLSIGTTSPKTLDTRTLTIQSGVNAGWFSTGILQLANGGNIANAGIFDAQDDATIANSGAAGGFVNSGTFKKSAGAGTTAINNVTLTNTGIVQVQTGTLNPTNVTSSGAIELTGTLLVDDGVVTLNGASDVSGTGLLHINGGTLAVDTADTLPNVQLDIGFLQGTAVFDLTSLTWNGGTMQGAGTTNIPNPGSATIATASAKSLQRSFSIASGTTASVTGNGPINLSSGGNISNAGIFDFAVDGFLGDAGGDGGFLNTGTFRKSAGAGSTSLTNVDLTSSGTIQVQTGTLNPANVTASGPIQLTGNFVVDDGTVTFNAGTDISGTGLLQQTSSFINANAIDTIPNVQLDGGTFQGTANVSITSLLWNNGTMDGAGTTTIPAGATATLATPSGKILRRSLSIANTGTVTVSGNGSLSIGPGGNIANDGLFDITTSMSILDGGSAGDILNTRTFRSNAAVVNLTGVTFNNSGASALLDVLSGSLDLADGTSTGPIALGATANLLINSDTYTLATGTTVTGAGAINLSGGTLSVTGNIDVPRLNQSGGFVDGTGTLTLSSSSSWTGGTMQGAGSTSVSGTLDLNTASAKSLTRALSTTAAGQINLSGTGTLSAGAGSSISNSGTFLVTADSSVNDSGSAGNFTNNASGIFRKMTATGTTFFTGVGFINNGGLVDLQTGILNVNNDTFTQSAGKLKLWLGGTSPGIGFSQVVTDTSPSLAGELEIALVGLYQPIGGDTFLVLSAATHTGDFAPYTYPALAFGRTFSNAYTGSGLVLTVNGEGDLAIDKNGPSNVLVNDPVAYTLQVDNNGPDVANSLSVTDTLEPGHTAINASGTGWTCNVIVNTVTCTMPSLAVGSANLITINATAPGSPTSFVNSATVTSSNDSNTGDNTDTLAVTVDPYQADLELSSTSPATPLAPATAFTFDFTIANNGPQTATAVVFTAPIPTTLQYDNSTPDAGTCNFASDTVTCNVGNILSGDDVHVVIDLTTVDPGTHTVTGTGTATEVDPNPGDNSITSPVSVTGPALVVTNTDDAGAGSLRQALEDAANGVCTLPCGIDFTIGSGPFVIQPLTELPAIGNQVLLDATTQPGYSGVPIIELDAAPANLIAGLTLSGTGSAIKGFSIQGANIGVKITGDNNALESSYIGLTPADIAAANGDGIEISGDDNTIGGTSPAQRNIISGNTSHGLLLSGTATGNDIAGNYIGTDSAGTAAMPQDIGIEIIEEASTNTIGGTTAAHGNVIAGNQNYQIYIAGSGGMVIAGGIGTHTAGNTDNNAIYNNNIGADSTGTATLGAAIAGIAVMDNAIGTQIGAPDQGNVIGGNDAGIILSGAVEQTIIAANQIGRALDQVTNIANTQSGIVIDASNNLVGGGLFNGHNNIINNGNDGITVLSGIGNRLLVNSIYDNGDRGIDLGDDGVTPNDVGDADTGPNNLQNSPTLTDVLMLGGGDVHIAFNFDSSAAVPVIGSVRVEMFEADSNGQGAQFFSVGCHAVNSAGIGSNFNAPSITLGMPVVLTMTSYADASCTNVVDGTSEFSNVVTATACTPPAMNITGPTTSCAGGTVVLDAGPGFSEYLWSTGEITQQITVAPTITTIYSVTVKDGVGCPASDTHTVNVNPLPTPTITGPTSVCATGSVVLDAGPGYTGYLWSTGAMTQQITVSPAITTNYSVTVTDGNTCQGTDSHTVTVNANPTVTITGPTSMCAGANVVLDAGPGFANYAWSTGELTQQITVSPAITTNYSVTVTDGNGCNATDSHNVTVNPLPAATITPGGPTTFCAGGSVTLTASAGASWLWSNGAVTQQITVTATSTLSVQVTSAAGCSATSAPTSVTVNPLPVVTITGPTSSCAGAPVLLDAGPGFAGYLWSNGALTQQITVNPAITTNYSVTVTDGNSCQGTDSHTVTVTSSPTATINVAPNVCENSTGNTANVASQPGATYVWSIGNGSITSGAGTNAIVFTAGPTGTVTLGVTVTSGSCVSNGNANVPIVPPPTVTITGPTTACANTNVTLDAGAGFATYVWSNGATTPTISVASNFTTTYTVNVTTASGCAASDSHTVTITPAPSAVITAPSGADANESGLAASVTAQPGATYSWSVLNGTLTSGNGTNTIVFAAGASGVTEVRVTVSLGGCSSSFEHFVFIASNGTGADLRITKSAPATVQAGGAISYTIGVANLGPEAATGVVITDDLPAGTSFVSVSGGPWACVQTAGGIRCTGNAAPASNSTITLTVNAPQSGNVTNTAQITATTSDPNPANNSASATTNIVAAPPEGDPCVTRPVATTLAPSNNAVVNASSIEFRWTAVHGAEGYRLFASIDGAAPAVLGTTRETSLRVTIGRGDIVWFVQSLFEGCAATESQRSRFTIPTRNDCTTQSPQPLSPANGATTTTASVNFTWSAVPGAVLYELWLSLDNGSPALVGTTQGTTLTQLVPPGNLHWFVRAIVERCGPQSSQRSRLIHTPPVACATLERPIPIAPLFGAIANSPLGFLWSDVGASSYDLYVRRGDALDRVATTNATAASGLSLAAGKIRWFVRANFPGNCSPLDSAEQELEIVATPTACSTLSAPVIAAPGQISSGVPFFIQWLPSSGATSYELQLADNAGFTTAQTVSTSSTLHEIVRTNTSDSPLAVFARARAIDARCAPPAPGAFGPTSAIFILPNGSDEGSAPVIGGNVTFTISLGAELAGQMFNAVAKQPWLTVMPASGIVRETGTELTVIADTETLPLGTSLGAVTITLNSLGAGKVATHSTTVSPSFSVSLVTPVMPDPSNTPPPDALIIPAIAHADGINSHFQSDVRVSNTSPRLINYQLTYTPSGQGIGSGQQTTFSVEPGRTIALDDILKSFFGTGTGSAIGTLEIRPLTETTDSTSSAPFNGLLNLLSFATSRTFNVTANGTFGQSIPAIPYANFIGRAAAGDVRRVLSLQQIAQSPQFRTNLGLLEGSGQDASLIVRIFGNAGEYLTEFPVNLRGGQHLQLNAFLREQGVDPITDGRVEVEVMSEGGKVTAYASVLDNATSDPLLVTPVSVADSGASKWVMPGVADLASGFANWQTDMRLFNAGTEAVDATLLFYSQNGGEPKTANLTIPAGQVRQFDRALTSIFNTTNDGGAVHITTPAAAKLIATARTYNQTTTGTYGQFISAVTLAEAASLNTRPLQLLQVEESDRFRSNVGLVEMSGKPVVLEISIVPPDAKFTAVTEVPLAANEFRQLGSLLASFGLDDTHNARVTVRVISGEGLVTAYASVIDMQTNDPTYVPAQ